MTPMEFLDSWGWKLTLPTKVKATPDEVVMPELLGYASEWFRLNGAGDGVVFVAPTDGATTRNSKNPRSELREMMADGKTRAAWSSWEGTHSMEIEQSVDVLPIGRKPVVVVGQIHDGEDDVTVFRLEGNTTGDRQVGKLWITDGDRSRGHLLTEQYRLGERFRVGFYVQNGTIRYMFNGQALDYTQPKRVKGCYFKAGAYCQSGGIVTRLADGRADYAQVTIYGLRVCHDGVCTGRAVGPVVAPPVDPSPVGDWAAAVGALRREFEAYRAVNEARWSALRKVLG